MSEDGRPQQHTRIRPSVRGGNTKEQGPHPDAGAGEEVFASHSNRDLLEEAGRAILMGVAAAALGLSPEAFSLAYAIRYFGSMVILGTAYYASYRLQKGELHRGDIPVVGGVLAGFWGLAVFLPVTSFWSGRGAAVAEGGRDALLREWLSAAPVCLVLLAWSSWRARNELRFPDTRPGPTLFRPFVTAALAITAFVLAGPGFIYPALREIGAAEPLAVSLTFGMSEAFPFAGTLVDRVLERRGKN